MNESDHTEDNLDPQLYVSRDRIEEGTDENRQTFNEFDAKALARFLDTVFGDQLDEDEFILGWMERPFARPGYPRDADDLLQRLNKPREKGPRSLYFGTATMRQTEDGDLRNVNKQMSKLYLLVLDDIGTKVDPDSLPEALRDPTYIIESSEGNFQYGYVFDQPIDNPNAARTLVKLIYRAGVGDSGGALAAKLVRLPGGINGKSGTKGRWRVRLTHWDEDRQFTPQELLDAAGVNAQWDEILADARAVERSIIRDTVTPWASVVAEAPGPMGRVDPVLEWLYERDFVVQDNGDWVVIRCPWREEHTTGSDVSYYSPLGRGDEPAYLNQRGWKCHHGHCSDRMTMDFLAWVAMQGGPEAPQHEPHTPLHDEWVYDPQEDRCFHVLGEPRMVNRDGVGRPALRNLYPRMVRLYTSEGKPKNVPVTELWVKSPTRVLVAGHFTEPANDSPIITRNGFNYINDYEEPGHGTGEFVEDLVIAFTQFLAYLIPNSDEREFFINWLAAKVQNGRFRGPAILMVAGAQGTGRGTLAEMIKDFLGQANVTEVPYDKLIEPNGFNEWQTSLMAITHETRDMSTRNQFRGYERLKSIIDTAPAQVTINRKGKNHFTIDCYTSHLMFSNHVNALPIPDNDRRFYVVSNAEKPADPEYFTELRQTMRNRLFAQSVVRWLRTLTPDMDVLNAPAQVTEARAEMIEASRSDIDKLVDALLAFWGGDPITPNVVREVAQDVAKLTDQPNPKPFVKACTHEFRQKTIAIKAPDMAAMARLRDDWGTSQGRLRRSRIVVASDTTRQVESGRLPPQEGFDLALDGRDKTKTVRLIMEALEEMK